MRVFYSIFNELLFIVFIAIIAVTQSTFSHTPQYALKIRVRGGSVVM